MERFNSTPQSFATPRRGPGALLILVLGLGLALAGACHRKTPEEKLREAFELFQNRDILGAEMKYEDLLKKSPTGDVAQQARLGLATCFMQDNDFERGREQLDLTLKDMQTSHPQYLQVLAMKLQSYVYEKKPEKALAEAEATSTSLRAAPLELRQQFQLMLAEVCLANKKDDRAMAILNQVIEQWPDNPELHSEALDRMVWGPQQKKEFDKALVIYQNYLDKHPKTPLKADLLFGIGAYQRQLKQDDKAKESFDASEAELRQQVEKALGAEAKGQFTMKLARVQQGRGNLAGAKATLEKMSKDNQGSDMSVAAKFMLSDLAMADNKTSEAIGILQDVMKAKPETQAYYAAMQKIQQIQQYQMRMQAMATSATLARAGMTTGTLATSGTLPQAAVAAPTTATAAKTEAAPAAPAAAPKAETAAPVAASKAEPVSASKPAAKSKPAEKSKSAAKGKAAKKGKE